jgi:hypothetical protein
VQTGVKSPGWENNKTHFPLYWDKVMGPSVVMAVKSGAILPIVRHALESSPPILLIIATSHINFIYYMRGEGI